MTDLTYEALPDTIRTYFERTDISAESFTDDASVTDDGKHYRGHSEIAAWLDGAASAFEYTTTFLNAQAEGDAWTVTSRLNGSFPGGSVELQFRFKLHGTRIKELVIAP